MVTAVSIISIDLLELGAQALFGFGWGKEILEFLDGLANLLFITGIVPECYAKLASHLTQCLNGEVTIFVYSSSGSTKWRL